MVRDSTQASFPINLCRKLTAPGSAGLQLLHDFRIRLKPDNGTNLWAMLKRIRALAVSRRRELSRRRNHTGDSVNRQAGTSLLIGDLFLSPSERGHFASWSQKQCSVSPLGLSKVSIWSTPISGR
jgi:hypothetical protein